MAKRHEENSDVLILARKCNIFVDTTTKRIRASKTQVIGNKAWGRIDFLTGHCGYVFIWDNTVISKNTKNDPDSRKELNKSKKTIKKMRKDAEVKPKRK